MNINRIGMILLYILMIALCLIVSGCWDRHELQDQHFVLAVGIDTADQGAGPDQGKAVTRTETFVQPHGSKKYRLSFQILEIKPSQGDSKSGGKTSTYVISNTGESMFEMLRDMLGQVSRGLLFKHIQAVVISEAVVKESGLEPLVDLFGRDSEMRWRMKVLLTSGQARSILEYQPQSGEPGGIFMANTIRLHSRSGHIPGARTDMGYLVSGLDNKSKILLPRIELVDKVMKIGGMAVFEKGKFVGYVDEYAVKGGKLIVGTEKSVLITADCPEHPGRAAVFELYRHDTKLTPHVDGDNIYFTLDIVMWGNVGELQCAHEHNTQDIEYIHQLEALFSEEVKQNVIYALDAYQKMGVDTVSFGDKLKAHEPETWAKVKDQWNDEIFPKTPMIISVNVIIKGIGEHK